MKIQIVILVTLLAFVNTNIIQNIQIFDNENKTKEDSINENNEKNRAENIKEEEKQLELDIGQISTENKEDRIKALEDKRDDIMKNITEGINDSITMLQETNDSDAFIKDLKDLRSDIVKLDKVYRNSDSNNDTRRLSKLHNYMKKLPREMQIRIKNDRKLIQEKAAKMFKKLQDEADERRRKKKKTRRTGGGRKHLNEKCSKYGFKSGSKDSYERKSKKRNIKEPCCRKCCEKSYLGCL
ncbi:putative leucine-rich repeat-containing protein DDB_G0290503 [Aricia agestis]|uniref:putative leucine-rich repeat-containing protein DDB_G0290503 n=1 Tax=Aricia agestis TaxID=91739 RepID=UPI001C20A0F0|nr:putative leucine-rich repeat-containing protein DDB_G0290503 [Aricia agestis]